MILNMKHIPLSVLLCLGLSAVQSCAKQPQECECLDMTTEIMKGEREVNYNETFRKEYRKNYKDLEIRCNKFFDEAKKKGIQEKIFAKMRACKGFPEYTYESDKQTEHFDQQLQEQMKGALEDVD